MVDNNVGSTPCPDELAATSPADEPAATVAERRLQRKTLLEEVQALRNGRCLVSLFTFDRPAIGPLHFAQLQFREDVKQALYRVLKESCRPKQGLDLVLYTRGGDVNAVWPIVSLLREFDPDFEVLIPFRAHSAGTLLSLGARKVHMGPLSELSPIDPTTANQFNPTDASGAIRAISVEDVAAYMQFVRNELQIPPTGEDDDARSAPSTLPTSGQNAALPAFLDALMRQVHPLAIGNVQRVYRQIGQLADRLLKLHNSKVDPERIATIIRRLTSDLCSHQHKISRHEATEILGPDAVVHASQPLSDALDKLLVLYDEHFSLTKPFSIVAWLGNDQAKEMRWISGALESSSRSYLFETKARIRQSSILPPNVQVQLPPGQPMPVVPGLPRQLEVEVLSQRWMHNTSPQGVTV